MYDVVRFGVMASVLVLTACGGSGVSVGIDYEFAGQSGFVSDTSAAQNYSFDDPRVTSETVAAPSGRLGAAVGFVDGEGMIAVAGIDPSVTMGAARSAGSATFTGNYFAVGADNITESGSTVSGIVYSVRGGISLDADFDAGTLSGRSDDTALTVNGTFQGTDLDGTVSIFGNPGELDGVIGADGAAGVFHGGGNTALFGNEVTAGGFVVQ